MKKETWQKQLKNLNGFTQHKRIVEKQIKRYDENRRIVENWLKYWLFFGRLVTVDLQKIDKVNWSLSETHGRVM